jgi:hypothetical protein
MKPKRIRERLKQRREDFARLQASAHDKGASLTRPGSLNGHKTGAVHRTGSYSHRNTARKRSQEAHGH